MPAAKLSGKATSNIITDLVPLFRVPEAQRFRGRQITFFDGGGTGGGSPAGHQPSTNISPDALTVPLTAMTIPGVVGFMGVSSSRG